MRNPTWKFVGPIGLVALCATTTSIHAAGGDSASPAAGQVPWAQWQGRLSLGTGPATANAGLGGDESGARLRNVSVMGDYYFGRSLVDRGGFRATSGMIFGPRSLLATGQPTTKAGTAFSIGSRLFGASAMPATSEAPAETTAVPYLGLGYTSLSSRSRWSFNADLGLVGHNPGGLKPTRSQGLDDAVRELRLAPLLQFGMSYAF